MQVTSALVVERLVASRRCSQCGGSYDPEDVHVLARRGTGIWELAAVCRDCCTLSLIRAVARRSPRPAPRCPWFGELTAAEQHRFGLLPPIRRNDVLDATAFLAAFDGDFQSLFHIPPEGL